MEKLMKGIGRLSTIGGYIAAAATLIMAVFFVVDITGRVTIGVSTLICDEISGYLLVVITYLGQAYTLKMDSHIRMTLVLSRFRQRLQDRMDIYVSILSIAFCTFFGYSTLKMILTTKKSGMVSLSIIETPYWIPQVAILVGLVLFTLQFVVRMWERAKGIPSSQEPTREAL